MQIIIYDTEFTAWEGSAQRKWSEDWEARELIQFAGIKLFTAPNHFKELEVFSTTIQPQKNPMLSEYIQNLTRLTQTEIDQGLHPLAFFDQLHQFTQQGQIPMISWGNDILALQETANLNQHNLDWIKSYNLIPLFHAYGIGAETTSGQLYKSFHLDLEITEHNALDDTQSLVASIKHLHRLNPKKTFQDLKNLLA